MRWFFSQFVIANFAIFITACADLDIIVEDTSMDDKYTITVERLYGNGETYCAFTSLIEHNGVTFVAFREGKTHVSAEDDNGVIRIIRSVDGIKWQLWQTLSAEGIDLRDPDLSIMPDGKMLLLCGARREKSDGTFTTRTYYSIQNGEFFSEAKEATLPPEFSQFLCSWIWKLTWNKNEGYGVVYGHTGINFYVSLLKTSDGHNYKKVVDFSIPGESTETRLRFLSDGTMIAFVRKATNENGYIGKSQPPYVDWNWTELPFYLAGHDFIISDNNLLCCTRLLVDSEIHTAIYYGTLDDFYQSCYVLPSAGDSAYSGIIIKDNSFWISYHSMHETYKPCIYLAKMPRNISPLSLQYD